jgi:hypothetical protein
VNMLYIIGLGLGGAKDITVRGLEIVKRAERVYLESYTSILTVGKDVLVRLGSCVLGYVKCIFKMPNVRSVIDTLLPDTFLMHNALFGLGFLSFCCVTLVQTIWYRSSA